MIILNWTYWGQMSCVGGPGLQFPHFWGNYLFNQTNRGPLSQKNPTRPTNTAHLAPVGPILVFKTIIFPLKSDFTEYFFYLFNSFFSWGGGV